MPNLTKLGKKIKASGLTIQEVCDKTGIPRSTLNGYIYDNDSQRHNINAYNVLKIANVLGCTMEELL